LAAKLRLGILRAQDLQPALQNAVLED